MATIEEQQESGTIESGVDGEVTSTIESGGGASTVSDLTDVDVVTEGKQDGSVLVYNNSTGKWVSTLKLEKQVMNAGFF